MTPAEKTLAAMNAEILRDPRRRAKWLSTLGEHRQDYLDALAGNPPWYWHDLDRALWVEIGRLLGPAIVSAL